jgi:hypothetical protein
MPNSQISVSNDFPQGMSNKQLQAAVNDYLAKVRESGSQENIVIQCYPLIALGLNELQARQNKIVTCISIFIGGVSLIVAGVALYISIAGTDSSDKTSARQVALLEELNKNVLESHKAVKETLFELQATLKQQVANSTVKRDAPTTARPLP